MVSSSLSLSSLSNTALRAYSVSIRGGSGVMRGLLSVVVVGAAATRRRHLPYRIHIGWGLGLLLVGGGVVEVFEVEVGVTVVVVGGEVVVVVGVCEVVVEVSVAMVVEGEIVGGVVEVEVFEVVEGDTGVVGVADAETATR